MNIRWRMIRAMMPRFLLIGIYVSTCISRINAVSPQQSFVFVGSEVNMPCRTTSRYPVEWKFWAVGVAMPKYVYVNNRLLNGYSGPDGRHSVKSNASFGIFDLVIVSIRTLEAGTYKCCDDVGQPDNENAIYEITVIDSPPTCSSNVSLEEVFGENNCNIEPDHIKLSCNVLFHGNFAPVLQWTHSTNGRGILDESTTSKRTLNSNNNSRTFLTFQMNTDLKNTFFTCAIEKVNTTGNTSRCTLPSIHANYFFNDDQQRAVENCQKPVKSKGHLSDVKCEANTSIRSCDYNWRSQNSSRSFFGSNSKIQLSELEPGTYHCFASCNIGRRTFQCPEYTACLVLRTDDVVGSNNSTYLILFCITLTLLIVLVVVLVVVYFAWKNHYSWFERMRNRTEEAGVSLIRAKKGIKSLADTNTYLNDKTLVNCLDVGNGLAEYLLSKEILTVEQFNRIDKESNWPTYQDQNRALLEIIFPLVRDNWKFIEALQATDQSHIAKYISRLYSESEYGQFEDDQDRPMTDVEISCVDRNFHTLINSINPDERFLNVLHREHCITERHEDRIMEHGTKSSKNKQLLSIIRRRSFANFQQFKIALGETTQHDVLKLLNVENDPTDRSNEGKVFLPMGNVASSSV